MRSELLATSMFIIPSSLPPPLLPKLNNLPPIPLRRSALGRWRKIHHQLSLLRDFHPQITARLRLPIERARHRRRAAHFAEQQHLHLKIAALGSDLQKVTDPDIARRLGRLAVDLNAAQLTCPRSQRPSLEKPGSPEPLVHPH